MALLAKCNGLQLTFCQNLLDSLLFITQTNSIPQPFTKIKLKLAVCCTGNANSVVVLINEVVLNQAQLVVGWNVETAIQENVANSPVFKAMHKSVTDDKDDIRARQRQFYTMA